MRTTYGVGSCKPMARRCRQRQIKPSMPNRNDARNRTLSSLSKTIFEPRSSQHNLCSRLLHTLEFRDLFGNPLSRGKLAVILGMVHVMLPFMILPIYSALTRIDPDLPKAARGLGASAARIFTTIYLPLTLRGIIAGVTLVFVVSLGFYITPALLGGGKVMMFAMVIEQQVREFLAWNFAGALSVILLAVTLMMFWLLNKGVARHLRD